MGAESVLGIDISEKMLAYAVEYNGVNNIEYQCKTLEELKFIKGNFDLVTSSLVFDYVEDFDKLVKDVYDLMDDYAFIIVKLHVNGNGIFSNVF